MNVICDASLLAVVVSVESGAVESLLQPTNVAQEMMRPVAIANFFMLSFCRLLRTGTRRGQTVVSAAGLSGPDPKYELDAAEPELRTSVSDLASAPFFGRAAGLVERRIPLGSPAQVPAPNSAG